MKLRADAERAVTMATSAPKPSASLLERDEERGLLGEAWRAARAGRGSLWFLCAEAGGGKSRLAAEAAALGPSIWGAADPLSPPDPYVAVCRALPDFSPAASRAASAQAAVAALRARAAGEPLVIILDDLHFADDGTVAVLTRLATECVAERWLILAAFRPGEGPPGLAGVTTELVAQRAARRLDLAPLTPEAVATLVAELRGRPVEAAEAAAIHAGGGGNPWFTEALAQGDRALAHARDRVHLRLRRLEERAPGAYSLAAALAPATRPLTHDLVAALWGEDGPKLRRTIAVLRDDGVLVEAVGGWRFRHELLRRALLDALLDVERREAHLALAVALSGEGNAAELAMHFAAAGDARAVPWARQAARAAIAVEAHTEAMAQLERALGFELDDATRRDTLYDAALEAFTLGRFAASRDLAESALALDGGVPERVAELHWVAARASTSLGDIVADERHMAAAEAALAGRPVTFQAAQLAQARVARAASGALPARLTTVAAAALALVAQLEDRKEAARIRIEIERALLGARFHRGDPTAFAALDALLTYAIEEKLDPGHALAAVTGMYAGAVLALFHDDADRLGEHALAEMRRLEFAWEGYIASSRLLAVAQRGRYAEARALAGDPTAPPPTADMLGTRTLALVLVEARAGTLEKANEILASTPKVLGFRDTVLLDLARLEVAMIAEDAELGEMAWWLYHVGEARERARVVAVAAVALARAGGDVPPPPTWLAPDAPLRVFWLWADGIDRRDPVRLRQVAQQLAEMQLPFEAAMARADAGELAEAYRALRALDATTARESLAARLRAAGQPVPRRTRAAVAAAGLTETERAVGRLITAGARNQEVAAQLGVSVHTVETHVTHLYQKTGVRGRMALAAWWREQAGDPPR